MTHQESPLWTRKKIVGTATVAALGSLLAIGAASPEPQTAPESSPTPRPLSRVALDNLRYQREAAKMLEAAGVSGDHRLDLLLPNDKMQVSGYFFIATGEIEGKEVETLRFAWQTNTEDPVTIFSELPLDSFEIKDPPQGEENFQPTITFEFDMDKFYELDHIILEEIHGYTV